MIDFESAGAGRFCWLDLAASDLRNAKEFYARLFGWTSHEQLANGGSFTRLRRSGHDVGSIYQLKEVLLRNGMPSHWTPYVRVDDIDESVRQATRLGGAVVVRPFAVSGVARIALILDSVGALVGLWEPVDVRTKVHGHG